MMVSRFSNEIFIMLCILIIGQCNIIKNVNICNHHNNGRRLYLELGERGILYASNISGINNRMEKRQMEEQLYKTNNNHNNNGTTWRKCNLEIVTCPSCAIIVTFKNINLPHTCADGNAGGYGAAGSGGGGGIVLANPCRCDHVWISEPPYNEISGMPFCGVYTPMIYRSYTRTVSIAFLYVQSWENAFTLEYVSERNRVHLDGSHDAISRGINNNNNTDNNSNGSGAIGGILSSPFFPARYPRDLGLEYVITCPSEIPACKVRVLFSDFQLATVSIIEFYDWDGQRLDVSSGARFRPPIIVSSGPSLLIRFYANGGTGLGYKAFYSYVIGHHHDDNDNNNNMQPITDCGGYVENLGGTITMMDMVDQGTKTYDCVWLIRPPKNLLHMKTHLYVKVITFADMVGNAELIIRQGPTSALLPLEILKYSPKKLYSLSSSSSSRLREHISPISSGFHVSLRGTFGVASRVAIAYAAFGYMDCFSSSDFLCHNHRCIASQLSCDGFDHCGDNSDEPPTCFRTWEDMPQDRKWHLNKANYYFPKLDRYPDLKTATLVFVASSLGLVILISALIILLYRMGARARQQRELQSRLQTISELLVFDITDGARIDEISINGGGSGPDDPPMYEAPPGYDEVVKIGLENKALNSNSNRKRRRYQQQSGGGGGGERGGVVAATIVMRSTNHSPSHQQQQQLQSINVVDGISESSSMLMNNTFPNKPESPPPPYITPPETISRNSIPSRNNILHISVPMNFRGNRSQNQQQQPQIWQRQSSFPGVNELTNIQLAAAIESTLKYNANTEQSSANFIGKNIIYHHHHHHHRRRRRRCRRRRRRCNRHRRTCSKENISEQEDEKIINRYQQQLTKCCCEGACGCANQSTSTAERPESSSFQKSTILRLLGTNNNKSITRNTDQTSPTTSSQSHSVLQSHFLNPNIPIETILKCSRDDGSSSSDSNQSNSQSKLDKSSHCSTDDDDDDDDDDAVNDDNIDEFEIISNEFYHEHATATTITTNQQMVNCSTCDLESLYKNIERLDNFLAKQNHIDDVINH